MTLGLIARVFAVLLLPGVLQACSTASAPDSLQRFKGVYIRGVEVSAFTPCGSHSDYWLSLGQDSTMQAQLLALINRIRDDRQQPYPRVYLEFLGEDVGKASDGFAADYPGVIQLHRILTFADRYPAECHH